MIQEIEIRRLLNGISFPDSSSDTESDDDDEYTDPEYYALIQAQFIENGHDCVLTKMNDVFADVCNAAGIEKTKRRGYYGWLREQYSYGHGQSKERAKRASPPPTRFPLHFNDPFGKG